MIIFAGAALCKPGAVLTVFILQHIFTGLFLQVEDYQPVIENSVPLFFILFPLFFHPFSSLIPLLFPSFSCFWGWFKGVPWLALVKVNKINRVGYNYCCRFSVNFTALLPNQLLSNQHNYALLCSSL